jgi:hypothetical protein
VSRVLIAVLLFTVGCSRPESRAHWADPTPWNHREIDHTPDTHHLKPGYCWCDASGASHCMNDKREIEVTTNTCSIVGTHAEVGREK